jgi:hypothetical protein
MLFNRPVNRRFRALGRISLADDEVDDFRCSIGIIADRDSDALRRRLLRPRKKRLPSTPGSTLRPDDDVSFNSTKVAKRLVLIGRNED